MNIQKILLHKVFSFSGVWYSEESPLWNLMQINSGVELHNWSVPGMEQPDIASFTEQDSADAELAWAQHVQAIKSPARKAAENRFIDVCDSIKGTTHQPFGPEEARTLYDAAVAAGNFQLATQLLGQWLLAAVGLLAADIGDVSYHSES